MATTSPPGVGLLKGLGVTIKHLGRRPATQMYPKERPDLAPRTRGVIALMDENCTVCMLCARECPDWCIYIDSHKETVPPAKEGGRARTRNVLDRFAIDFSLCMYCGICVEVCPFDALWWSPEFEYTEYGLDALLHEMGRLREWMDTVPPPPGLDDGAVPPAEVVDAIESAEKALAAAAQPAVPAAEAGAGADAADGAAGGDAPAAKVAPKKADVHVEGGQMDQATYDQLIAEGKSERMARAKAKAAWVRAEKQRILDEGSGGDAPAEDVTADASTEAGAEPAADGEAESGDDATDAADDAAGGDAPAAKVAPKKADVHVEGGQMDQATYDQLIAEGKSERMARAKAKAAWVRAEKQRILDEGGGE
ncbi:MAG: NADH-quinone oxidoreductase subunit I [Nitriliruptoraceae bacterium]